MFRSPSHTHSQALVVAAPSSAAPLALSALTVGTAIALSLLGDGPQFRAEGVYLALLMAAPLGATLLLAAHPAQARRVLWVPSMTLPLLLLLALAALPAGPLRGSAVALLLALSLAISGAVTLGTRPTLARWSLFALGSGALLQAHRFLAPELDVAALVHLVVLPVLAGIAAAVIARRRNPAVALTMVTLGLLGAGSWSPILVGGLLAVAAVLELVAALRPDGTTPASTVPARASRRSALLAIIVVLLTVVLARAAYPWLRQESTLSALVRGRMSTATTVTGRQLSWPPATLDRQTPVWQSTLSAGGPGLGVLVDSALANGAHLEVGTVVARVTVEVGSSSAGPYRQEWPLRAGVETGEWAAARPDLRGLPSPAPWLSWVDSSGEFFGQRYRARLESASEMSGEGRLTITLEPGLPENCQLTLYSVSTTSR